MMVLQSVAKVRSDQSDVKVVLLLEYLGFINYVGILQLDVEVKNVICWAPLV